MVLPGSVLTGLSIRRYVALKAHPSYPELLAAPMPDELRRWGIHLLFQQALDGSLIIGDTHEYADVAQPTSSISPPPTR